MCATGSLPLAARANAAKIVRCPMHMFVTKKVASFPTLIRYPRVKTLIASLLLSVLCAAAPGAEIVTGVDDGGATISVQPLQKKLDPKFVEKMRKLTQQLGDVDFDTRIAATNKILALGERAWPLLEPYLQDEDAERAQRVRELATQLAIVRPDQEALLQELLEKLEGSDDKLRAEGLDGMLNLGIPGIRKLRTHLAAQNSLPKLRLDLEHNTFTVGDIVYARGTLVNEGTGPMWRRNNNVTMYMRCNHARDFGEERPFGRFGCRMGCGRRLMVRRGGYFNPIRDWTCTPAGGVVESREFEEIVNQTGIYNATVTTTLQDNSFISPRIPGSEDVIQLWIGAGLNKEKTNTSTSVEVYSLPKPDAPSQDDYLALSISAAKNPEAGKILRANVSLASKWQDSTLRLESNLARYAWYAVLDNGVPVKYGSWESVLNLDKESREDALTTQDLEAGRSIDYALEIPLPASAGVYTLLVGYEVENLRPQFFGIESPFVRENDPVLDVLPYAPYEEGKLYSSIELRVK
jgi:hypothetical protein